jgi:hypothetical protein
MAAQVDKTAGLIHFMLEEDLVPDECVDIKVEFTVDAIPQIVYRVNLDDNRIERFQRAFTKYLSANRGQ